MKIRRVLVVENRLFDETHDAGLEQPKLTTSMIQSLQSQPVTNRRRAAFRKLSLDGRRPEQPTPEQPA